MAKTKPDEEKKAVPVSGRLTQSEFIFLERMADADDRSTSYLVTKAVREFLERNGFKPPKPGAK